MGVTSTEPFPGLPWRRWPNSGLKVFPLGLAQAVLSKGRHHEPAANPKLLPWLKQGFLACLSQVG